MLARDAAAASGLAGLTVPLGLGLILGLALPLHWGVGLPVAAVFGVWLVTVGRDRAIRRVVADAGGWPQYLAGRPARVRFVLGAATALAGLVFAAAAVRGVGGLLMTYPAAAWPVGGTVLAGLATMVRPGGAGRAMRTLVIVAVPALAIAGTRWEAAAPDARGWAHSGPLLGIHPFQITSVMVDGFGPYDLPINDYVEPDGGRGYGGPELAEAIENSLHTIAEVHFANGPARARQAFAGARVEFVMTDGVREQLDRKPEFEFHPRFRVTSGTYGPGSRVEFICPGTRNDPRPRKPDPVMNRMCVDKYAAEASAGIGVTGRWAGYTEGRGNERFGLARTVGATRSGDGTGQRVVRWELRAWGFGLLALAGLMVGLRAGVGGRAVTEVAGGAGLLAIALAVGSALWWMDGTQVGVFEPAPPWAEPFRAGAWVAALIPGAGIVHLLGRGRGSEGGWWIGIGFVPALLVTAGVASFLPASSWASPDLWGTDGLAPLQSFAAGVAGGLSTGLGASVQDAEAVVAGLMAVVCLGLAVSSVQLGARTLGGIVTGPREGISMVAVGGLVAGAACLVLSRKTGGGAALLWSALAGTIIVGSALAVLSTGRRAAVLAHVAWLVVAFALVLEPFLAGVEPSPLLLVGGGLGLVVGFGSLVALVGSDGPPDPPRPGKSGHFPPS